jgi:glutaredoxin
MTQAHLILYTKPDCPLCAALRQKLLDTGLDFTLEERDITTQTNWFNQYQFLIPVLVVNGRTFPRPAPRITSERLAVLLRPALAHPPCLSSEA